MTNNFSRDAYDTAILLAYFGQTLERSRLDKDALAYEKLVRDLEFLQVESLRSQHLEYLVKGLASVMGSARWFENPEQVNAALIKFIPNLIESIYRDLNRFGFRSFINSVTYLTQMAERSIMS